MMWREESGFLEMFLAYYSQFEENVVGNKAYRDFLFDIICAHEARIKSPAAVPSTEGISRPQSLNSGNDLLARHASLLGTEVASKVGFGDLDSVEQRHSGLFCDATAASAPAAEPNLDIKAEAEELLNGFNALGGSASVTAAECYEGLQCEKGRNSRDGDAHMSLTTLAERFQFESHTLAEMSPIAAAGENSDIRYEILSDDEDAKEDREAQVSHCPRNDPLISSTDTTGPMPQMCQLCNKSFAELSQLCAHECSGNDLTRYPYSCEGCNKTFTCASSIRIHKRVHCGATPYSCETCNKRFAHPADLKAHARIHTSLRPFVCTICNQDFTQSSTLRRHVLIHSGQRPHACNFCGRKFRLSSNLRRHERIHLGERPYACKQCDKCFTQSSTLRRHEFTHLKDSVFLS